ncbi:amino acid transporter [Gemmatimonadetes bacterium T265]|nr:amino acid transporter [Gemmatimonadetes bacterium T265]
MTAPVRLRRTLTTRAVVFLLFFTVSGGAFTTEALVADVGPGLALLLLAVVPVLWSVPEALLIGELASMLPEEGGYYQWVRRAFGPFWAFQNGWCTWLYSLVDMAIYPVLFTQYLAWFAPGLPSWAVWAVRLAVIWGATAINLRGALRVGRVSTWAGYFVIATFGAIGVAAFATGHARGTLHAPWAPFAKGGTAPLAGLGVGLSVAMWNYFGWDNASTVLGEVEDAGRAYPRALAVAVPLVAAGYFVPLLPTLAASDWTTWKEGAWPAIARATGGAAGPALAAAVAVAGMVSALALYNALLLAFSRVPLVLAGDGLLPEALARVDARGTPRTAVLVAAALYSLFTVLPFAQLVVADALLYALAMFLEFGALVRLRRREPGLRGPFRIPLGTAGVAALALLPAFVFVAATGYSIAGGEIGATAVLGSFAAVALGPVVYTWAARRRSSPVRAA